MAAVGRPQALAREEPLRSVITARRLDLHLALGDEHADVPTAFAIVDADGESGAVVDHLELGGIDRETRGPGWGQRRQIAPDEPGVVMPGRDEFGRPLDNDDRPLPELDLDEPVLQADRLPARDHIPRGKSPCVGAPLHVGESLDYRHAVGPGRDVPLIARIARQHHKGQPGRGSGGERRGGQRKGAPCSHPYAGAARLAPCIDFRQARAQFGANQLPHPAELHRVVEVRVHLDVSQIDRRRAGR